MPREDAKRSSEQAPKVRPVVSSVYWPENDPKAMARIEESRVLMEAKPSDQKVKWYQKDKSRRVRICICKSKSIIREDFELDGTQLEKLIEGKRPKCHLIKRKSGRMLWTDIDEDDKSDFEPSMDALPAVPGTVVREVAEEEDN